jgi:hypothetical protein
MATRRKKIVAAYERALEERSYENGDSPYVFDVSLDEMLAWIDIGGREVTLDELQDALAWAAAERQRLAGAMCRALHENPYEDPQGRLF